MKKIRKTKIVFRIREILLAQDESGVTTGGSTADFSDLTEFSVCPLCHSQFSLPADAVNLVAAPPEICGAADEVAPMHDCPKTENQQNNEGANK